MAMELTSENFCIAVHGITGDVCIIGDVLAETLKSRLATQFAILNGYRADF